MTSVSDSVYSEFERRSGENLAYWCLQRHLEHGRGNAIALNADGKDVSYAHLASCVRVFCSEVAIRNGDVVAILLPDSLSFASCFLGIIAAGATAVPISTRLASADLTEVLLRIRPRFIVVDRTTSPMLSSVGLTSIGQVVVDNGWWTDAYNEQQASPLTMQGGGEDRAYCLMSSGSTGAPKLVLSRHSAPIECLRAFERGVVPFEADERVMSSARLTFGYGLLGNLLFSLLNGSTSLLRSIPFTPMDFMDSVAALGPSMILSQPKFVRSMLARSVEPLRSARVVLSAGEPLSASLLRDWEGALATPLLDALGSTELGHIFIASSVGSAVPGKTGLLCPGYQAEVRDADGVDVGVGQIGELYARGPAMTDGYLDDHNRTLELRRVGWIRTGDMVSRDEKGYFQVHGRVDDLIKAGCGEWIIPGEVEAVAMEQGGLAECAVVAQQGPGGVSMIACFYVPSDTKLTHAAIEQHIQAAILARWPHEEFRSIDKFVVRRSLPRSANGKVSRAALRADLRAQLETIPQSKSAVLAVTTVMD
ncbi:AMP-binding protein [Devosia sp. CN2-171]|uniref:AMP-binding protein n=1 Tax=Devosia sp. CN2-171 TaxID=3400909 RepID=UPI003BF861EF